MKQWKRGDRVEARIAGKKIPAIVIESGIAQPRGPSLVKLRVAVWSDLHQRWFPSIYPAPMSPDKLTPRYRDIPGLDPDYVARDAAMEAWRDAEQ